MQKILVFPFDGIVPAVQNASCCDVLEVYASYVQQTHAVSMEFQL